MTVSDGRKAVDKIAALAMKFTFSKTLELQDCFGNAKAKWQTKFCFASRSGYVNYSFSVPYYMGIHFDNF